MTYTSKHKTIGNYYIFLEGILSRDGHWIYSATLNYKDIATVNNYTTADYDKAKSAYYRYCRKARLETENE